METVDVGGVQEAGRKFTWSGDAAGTLRVVGNGPIDLKRQANGDLSVFLEYRLDTKPTAPVQLSIACGAGCMTNLDATPQFEAAKVGQINTLKVKLMNFRGSDFNRLGQVTEPFVLATSGKLGITVKTVRLVADPTNAVTLAEAK
jgi:beta-glucosidase